MEDEATKQEVDLPPNEDKINEASSPAPAAAAEAANPPPPEEVGEADVAPPGSGDPSVKAKDSEKLQDPLDPEKKPMKKKKSRKVTPPISAREARLRRAMKPLTQKCIPDKTPKVPRDNYYAAPPRIAPRKPVGKEQVYHRSSKLAITMPKVREAEEISALKTHKMVHKLIKYMKKSWKVKVDPKQAERELVYRTIQSVYTRKPDNWEDLIEKREQFSIESGFFSGFDAPYKSLVNLELDTAMLVFNNLPPDLKISSARWLRYKARKEELKKKRDAFLPKLPNNRQKRPNFAKGKLVKDPGGLKAVDEFVAVAEKFQQLCKGSKYFAKVLSDWTHKKEDENENVNFGFGTVPADFRYGFAANRPEEEAEEEKFTTEDENKETFLAKEEMDWIDAILAEGFDDDEEEEETQEKPKKKYSEDRRDSFVDTKKYLREVTQMEYMISALYDIVKSILNIKIKQLNSNLPLPIEVVMNLREKSPEPKEKEIKKSATIIPEKVVRRTRRNLPPAAAPPTQINSVPITVTTVQEEDEEEEEMNLEANEYSDDEACKDLENDMKASIQKKRDSKRKSGQEKLLNDPLHLHAADFITSPVHSSHKLIEDVKKVQEMQERAQAAHMGEAMSPIEKLKSLIESPKHAALRMARNDATYGRLFKRHQKMKKPIWQDVQVDQYLLKYSEKDRNLGAKDPANLTETDAEEMVEMAIRKREMLPASKRWPDADDIPTPTFPFIRTPRRVSSEENSRRDLLSTMPHKDDRPPTPVRRLFRLAGVRTTEQQTYNTIYDMKRAFRATEKKFRVVCQNDILKMEFDTLRRYKAKLNAIYPDPVYQWTISMMRQATKLAPDEEDEDNIQRKEGIGGVRRQALWFRKLMEECVLTGATRHSGCQLAIDKLMKYCDIDMKSKQNLLSRLALLVVSLPTTELGTRHWQNAIYFLLENLFGVPKEVLLEWLSYRKLPLLIF